MDGIHDSIVANNQFVVGLNLDIYSFAKVTNITGKLELETIEEGGYNDSPNVSKSVNVSRHFDFRKRCTDVWIG